MNVFGPDVAALKFNGGPFEVGKEASLHGTLIYLYANVEIIKKSFHVNFTIHLWPKFAFCVLFWLVKLWRVGFCHESCITEPKNTWGLVKDTVILHNSICQFYLIYIVTNHMMHTQHDFPTQICSILVLKMIQYKLIYSQRYSMFRFCHVTI